MPAPLGRRAIRESPLQVDMKTAPVLGTGAVRCAFIVAWAVIQPGRRGQCRTPYGMEFHPPRRICQIPTMPDHTGFTRVATGRMCDSLVPGPAGRPVGRFCSSAVQQNVQARIDSVGKPKSQTRTMPDHTENPCQISIRRAGTSDRSGGFARVPSSKMYRLALTALENQKPRLVQCRTTRKILIRFPYAERELATGRAVLLECRPVKCTGSHCKRRLAA